MSRPPRTTLPSIATALALALPTPAALASTGPREPVGLAAAPWVLAPYFAAPPPDVGLPPAPAPAPRKKGGGGGIGAAPPPSQPPSSAPPPPSGGGPPSSAPPPPPAKLAPSTPPAPPIAAPPVGSPPVAPGGPPSVGAPGAPTPPAGALPNAPGGSTPSAPEAGVDPSDAPPGQGEKKREDEKPAEQPKTEEQAPEQQTPQDQVQPTQPAGPDAPSNQPPAQWQYWPYPYPPPRIIVSPQIQVQVNPRLDVQANPKSTANADANAQADAQANPNAKAAADIDTKIGSDNAGAANPSATPGAVAVPPAPVLDSQLTSPVPAQPDRDPLAGWATPRRGALITGLVLFGISYGSSAFSGYKLRNGCGTSNDFVGCRRTAKNMFIPVVGPALNISSSTTHTSQFAMAFAAGAQATGALLTVIGALIVHRDRRRNRMIEEAAGVRLSNNVSVGSGMIPRGGHVQLTARF